MRARIILHMVSSVSIIRPIWTLSSSALGVLGMEMGGAGQSRFSRTSERPHRHPPRNSPRGTVISGYN